jgi:hypothetical protein
MMSTEWRVLSGGIERKLYGERQEKSNPERFLNQVAGLGGRSEIEKPTPAGLAWHRLLGSRR